MTTAASVEVTLPYAPPEYNQPADLTTIYGSPVPKGSIRVIHIVGIGEKGYLKCRVERQRISKGGYSAISYTWNPDVSISYQPPKGRPLPVRINGNIVSVSEKICDILCLAHQLGRTAIWIDGICTKQHDAEDKSIQVEQMGSVYANANEILTVLNSPDADTDFLLDSENWTDTEINAHRPRMHKTLLKILANDYWRRTWVLQEIVLAPKILFCCGKRAVDFDALGQLFIRIMRYKDAAQFLRIAASQIGTLLKSNAEMDSERHTSPDGGNFSNDDLALFTSSGRAGFQKMQFLDLLDATRRFNRCFEPKDMIYARRAVACDGTQMVPQVRYKDSSMEDVLRDFAIAHVTKLHGQRQLRILTHTSWQPTPGLPSWVPDWRHPTGRWSDVCDEGLRRLKWSEYPAKVSQDGAEVHVRGRVLATVDSDNVTCFRQGLSNVARISQAVLQGKYADGLSTLLPDPPGPAPGDLICALAGCPAFVFLHQVEGQQKYVLTCKHRKFQRLAAKGCLSHLMTFDKEGHWHFRDLEKIGGIAEQIFTIV